MRQQRSSQCDGLRVVSCWTQVTGLKFRGAASDINISLAWYNASDGADGAIASGAYIFRCACILHPGVVDS